MKKAIFLLILIIGLTSFAEDSEYVGNLELVIEKQTNGSYVCELPRFSTTITRKMFVYKPELSLIFTLPRKSSGNPFKSNHHSVRWNNNMGFKYKDVYMTNSIGLSYIFEGNDDNLDKGISFFNTLTMGFKF